MTSAESDAVSGATPSSGTLFYTWNVIDEQGEPVPAGTHRVFLERAYFIRLRFSGAGYATELLSVAVHKIGTPECKNGMITNVKIKHTTAAEP